jgi:hypothetical protein
MTWRAPALLTASMLLALCATAAGASQRFSFRAIEFAPADERLPAARLYLDQRAAPGTPLPDAIAAVRRAGAHCGGHPRPDGAIRCRFAMPASNSFADMPPGDITWTVRLLPAADGRIAQATVTRERIGN